MRLWCRGASRKCTDRPPREASAAHLEAPAGDGVDCGRARLGVRFPGLVDGPPRVLAEGVVRLHQESTRLGEAHRAPLVSDRHPFAGKRARELVVEPPPGMDAVLREPAPRGSPPRYSGARGGACASARPRSAQARSPGRPAMLRPRRPALGPRNCESGAARSAKRFRNDWRRPRRGLRPVVFAVHAEAAVRVHPGIVKQACGLFEEREGLSGSRDAVLRRPDAQVTGILQHREQNGIEPLDVVEKRSQPLEIRLDLHRVRRRILAREGPSSLPPARPPRLPCPRSSPPTLPTVFPHTRSAFRGRPQGYNPNSLQARADRTTLNYSPGPEPPP